LLLWMIETRIWSFGPPKILWSGLKPWKCSVGLLMAHQILPKDFKEFLKLLTEHKVNYLLIGGYAVGFYGYPRTTGDMDVYICNSHQNARKMVAVFKEFGFSDAEIVPSIFQEKGKIIRIGVPPIRIEILTDIDGVTFDECYRQRLDVVIDDVPVTMISLEHLRQNKRASGRYKDLDDLENLPEKWLN